MNRLWLLFVALALSMGAIATAYAVDPAPVADKSKNANKTGIEWKVGPPNVVIFLDGKKLGDAGTMKFTETKPGKHSVKLMKGGDETEMDVQVSKGAVVTFTFEFTD